LEREKAEVAQGTSSAVVDIRLKQTIGSLQQQLQQQQTMNVSKQLFSNICDAFVTV